MAFSPINSSALDVGDPLKKELFDLIKTNFDDHETRILAASSGSAKQSLINTVIDIGSTATSLVTGCLFVEVLTACTVTEGSLQLFLKSPATSGSITIDVKRNTTTNPTGFNSLFTTLPTLNIATAANYQRTTGIINATYQSLPVGTILRLDITSIPVGLQSIKVTLEGAL